MAQQIIERKRTSGEYLMSDVNTLRMHMLAHSCRPCSAATPDTGMTTAQTIFKLMKSAGGYLDAVVFRRGNSTSSDVLQHRGQIHREHGPAVLQAAENPKITNQSMNCGAGLWKVCTNRTKLTGSGLVQRSQTVCTHGTWC